MPWESKSVAEARLEFAALASSPNANISALCRCFNISRKTAYHTLNRYRAEGETGLHDRSRRPHHTPRRTTAEVETAILAVRDDHPTWGPRKIAGHLNALGAHESPVPSTIGAILIRNGRLRSSADREAVSWMSALLHKNVQRRDLPTAIAGHPDVPVLLDRLRNGRPRDRKCALAILASRRGFKTGLVCSFLNISRATYCRSWRVFERGGAAALFARRINPHRKFDDEKIKQSLFGILHQPPSNFGINRTTWTMAALSRAMANSGQPAGEDVIRAILKAAGFRWRKARIVLTSNDPEFSAKVERIKSILAGLAPDEAFFSIDEYGPFAVKSQPGRALTGPGEQRLVPQWQKSRGRLILTAAVELASNQVSHFYSLKKNTAEMIKMMHVLVDQYRGRRKIYLSWDAASWHVSKELFRRIEKHNASAARNGPIVETAPLPARAQFLNVIESIFGGMARAIIQNSDYKSVDEARAAIDRYFLERNAQFTEHPRRAGNKIWGKEREPARFSEANNCKDPRFR